MESHQDEKYNNPCLYVYLFSNTAENVIKTFSDTKLAHLLRLLVVNVLIFASHAQILHNISPVSTKPFRFYDLSNARNPGSNEYSLKNRPFKEVTETIMPLERKYDHSSLLNRQVSPTSLVTRFQYSPSPSEATIPLYRIRDIWYQPAHSPSYDHQAVRSNRFQQGDNAWSHYGNGSGLLNRQASLSQALQREDALTALPKPRAFSELTDKVLIQAYRSKSPCFGATVDWVRDRQNCSVFFVCSRGRAAAIMTCPAGENWSNRVTNCVPIRSRWDDCTPSSRIPHYGDGKVTEASKSTPRRRRLGCKWRRLRTTVSPPLQSEVTGEDQELQKSHNLDNDHRYYKQRHGGYGSYYETGGRRLDLITNNRRGGYHVQSIQRSAKSQKDVPSFQRFPRRIHHSVVKDKIGAGFKKRKRLRNKFHRFERKLLTKNADRHDNSEHAAVQITPRLPSTHLTSSPPPIAASGSGTRPKIRFVITHSQRRRSRLRLNGTKIQSVKGGDLDFLHNIKKINELENDYTGEYPVKDHSTEVKESTTKSSFETSSESTSQWWSVEKQTTTTATSTSTTATKTSSSSTTTPATTKKIPHKKATNITNDKFLPECGVSATSMIVGGLPAQQGRWPWVVSLQLTWNQNHVCGATLIHPRWIVTAAHCVNGPDLSKANEWRALFWQKRTSKEVDVIVQHPGFVNGDNYPNDIALLRLSEPVDVSGFDLRHACMPKREEWRKKWDKCWIMGWGESKDDDTSELKELEVKVRKNSECSARWGWKRILNSHVCAGDGGRGACNGDSGGPLICRENGYHYLAGITSWGVGGCQTAGYPSVFTRVAFYYNWIQGVISAFSKP